MQYTYTLNRLINALNRLPGIGPKMAERLSIHILKTSREDVESLASSLLEVKEKIRNCNRCGSITEEDPCAICKDPSRNKKLICVVEQPQDVWAIERSHEYKGMYHVLMGVISPLDGIGPENLRIKELFAYIKEQDVEEIIIATNPTVEGDATAMYLSKLLKPILNRVSRIAYGIPVGADLEYTDEVTIAKALEGRRSL